MHIHAYVGTHMHTLAHTQSTHVHTHIHSARTYPYRHIFFRCWGGGILVTFESKGQSLASVMMRCGVSLGE